MAYSWMNALSATGVIASWCSKTECRPMTVTRSGLNARWTRWAWGIPRVTHPGQSIWNTSTITTRPRISARSRGPAFAHPSTSSMNMCESKSSTLGSPVLARGPLALGIGVGDEEHRPRFAPRVGLGVGVFLQQCGELPEHLLPPLRRQAHPQAAHRCGLGIGQGEFVEEGLDEDALSPRAHRRAPRLAGGTIRDLARAPGSPALLAGGEKPVAEQEPNVVEARGGVDPEPVGEFLIRQLRVEAQPQDAQPHDRGECLGLGLDPGPRCAAVLHLPTVTRRPGPRN